MLFTGSGSGRFNEIAYYSGRNQRTGHGAPFSWISILMVKFLLVTNGFSYDLENPDVQKDLTQATFNEGGRAGLVEEHLNLNIPNF